jgi:hypothetical protein
MENLLLLLAGTFAHSFSFKTKKRHQPTIGNTGCFIPFFNEPKLIQHWQTEEGEEVYFGEINQKNVVYGMVVVPVKKKNLVEPEIVLADLFSQLFSNMNMLYRTGIISEDKTINGKCIKTISEYLQNGHGIDFKVKGSTDAKTICLLYIKNISSLSSFEMEAYLNSISFNLK